MNVALEERTNARLWVSMTVFVAALGCGGGSSGNAGAHDAGGNGGKAATHDAGGDSGRASAHDAGGDSGNASAHDAGGDGGKATCVSGKTDACACAGGQMGVQTCGSDGTFGPCACADDSDAGGAGPAPKAPKASWVELPVMGATPLGSQGKSQTVRVVYDIARDRLVTVTGGRGHGERAPRALGG